MPANPHVDMPAVLVHFLEKETVFSGFHYKLILSFEKEGSVRPSSCCIQEWFWSFQKKRYGFCMVADFTVREAS